MTIYEIISKFKNSNYELYKQMQNTEHGYMGIYDNPYHLENIWEHTLLVMKEAENASMVQKLAALCHDVGKPETKKDQTNQRRSFFNHEGVSTFFVNHILSIYNISKEEKDSVIHIVANHGNFYNFIEDNRIPEKNYEKLQKRFSKSQLKNLFEFYKYDHNGRIQKEKEPMDKLYSDFNKIIETYPEEINQDPNLPVITVLIGLPRSGKSTFASQFKNSTIISRDDIVMSYPGRNYTEKWNSLSKEDQKNIDKTLYSNFQNAVKNKENIIIDMTNMSKKTRKKWLVKNYIKNALVFAVSIDECYARNTKDKFINKKIMKNMAKQFYYPDHEEFNNIRII